MIGNLFRFSRSIRLVSGRPDVVLHVGAPKSGSSAIQRWCVSHREELLQCGFFYPDHTLDSNGVSGGHSRLSGTLLSGDRDDARAVLTEWMEEAKREDASLLLSAEGLYGMHEPLREVLADRSVRVVAFLRHPADYLLGNHNQSIKRHMGTRRLEETLPDILSRSTGHLVGMPLLKWADAFGDEQCRFLPYRKPASTEAPIERRFLLALGLERRVAEDLVPETGGVTNRGYVKSALELKRLLNTVLAALPTEMGHEVDRCLQGYSDQQLSERGYTMSDLSPSVQAELLEHLLRQMDGLIERFPQLAEVARSSEVDAAEEMEAEGWLDLSGPLRALRYGLPEIVDSILLEVRSARDSGRRDYAFCKLMDVLGVSFVEPISFPEAGLKENQRQVFCSERSCEADYLRETAVLLEREGALEDALLVIERAAEKRPNGKGILAIRERLAKKADARRLVQDMGGAADSDSDQPEGEAGGDQQAGRAGGRQ